MGDISNMTTCATSPFINTGFDINESRKVIDFAIVQSIADKENMHVNDLLVAILGKDSTGYILKYPKLLNVVNVLLSHPKQ